MSSRATMTIAQAQMAGLAECAHVDKNRAQQTRTLSATGSMKAPHVDCCCGHVRAMYPSNASVTAARAKICAASMPSCANHAAAIVGTNASLASVRAFGTVQRKAKGAASAFGGVAPEAQRVWHERFRCGGGCGESAVQSLGARQVAPLTAATAQVLRLLTQADCSNGAPVVSGRPTGGKGDLDDARPNPTPRRPSRPNAIATLASQGAQRTACHIAMPATDGERDQRGMATAVA
mmetsp:Transcript_73068/g.202670  ORF Transcript_73068/g.202670 Transcript_73068/m.202670 type:complete len:235 (-) Transcript_73068:24-728(-)